ncbi:MAG: aspartate-alanine antiporter [Planctomycetaceae bacterium]|nr:aspartate-alanine antiporter [Planctomycetaceae bacterium]
MSWLVSHLHAFLAASPEIALFLSLALGYRLGKVNFGKFQLGGVAGSLLVAVIISQVGVTADNGLRSVLFALFIFAVGYESGPQFFRSLNKGSLREIFLAICLAVTGLATVVILAKLFHLDKGLAAGVAAGGLTQSAIIGTASDAIARLGLAADQVHTMQQNVAVGYAVTYIFGSLGTIIICVDILPRFMGKSIRDDAMAAEATLHAQNDVVAPEGDPVLGQIVGRVYALPQTYSGTVTQLESRDPDYRFTVERIKRNKRSVAVTPDVTLKGGDEVLVVGRREALLKNGAGIGTEVRGDDDMQLHLIRHDVTLTRDAFTGKPAMTLKDMLSRETTHGVYVMAVRRDGKELTITPSTQLEKGDVLTLYGSPQDVSRAGSKLGHLAVYSSKTDFVYMGLGMVVGLLIGLIVVRVAGLPLTLGSGGGALLSGLVFGWWRTRRPDIGYIPPGAVQILKDLGLAGFVAIVGLASGQQAIQTIRHSGISIFIVGLLVTIIPLILTMLIGRYVIGYKNSAILAGALTGSRSANPAFGEVLNKAGNSVPTVPFAITYALANVLLTLLGPLVVSLV